MCRIALNAHEYLNICTSARLAHSRTVTMRISVFPSARKAFEEHEKELFLPCRLFSLLLLSSSWFFVSFKAAPRRNESTDEWCTNMQLCTNPLHNYFSFSVKLYTTRTCVVRRDHSDSAQELDRSPICALRLYMIITWLCGEKYRPMWMCEWRNQSGWLCSRIDRRRRACADE